MVKFPVYTFRGSVQDFEHEPGARIYLGDDGAVGTLPTNTAVLNSDFELQNYMRWMEDFAGATQQAMGLRTPGEKTAFEVQTLQSGANRIFENKAAHFERVFEEPILNAMLEVSRRNMNASEQVRAIDSQSGAVIFQQVTPQDVQSEGTLKAKGARRFAERQRRLGSLQQLWNIKQADPAVGTHLSGKEFARILSEELGEKELFGENIGVAESLETQQAAQDAEVLAQEQLQQASEAGI